jgi:HEAT repeat protein
LIQQLSSKDPEQKRSALSDIRNLRTEQASRLALPTLNDSNEVVRATAATSVIFLPATEAVTALAPLLNDKAEFVRKEAAYALGIVGSAEASAPLLRLLQREKNLEVRSAAVIALGQSGDPSAIEPLVQILRSRPRENEEFIRRSAARSVGQIAQIIRTGKRKVLTPQNFLPERFKDVGDAKVGNDARQFPFAARTVPVMTQVLQNKNEAADTRREAAFALGAIGDPASVAVLQANQNSPDPYLAEISKEALLKIEGSK